MEQVDASLRDPLTNKPQFSGWSDLLNALLEGWLDGKFKVPQFEPFRANLEDLANDD